MAEPVAEAALASTAVIKLNGGLGTSMGLDRAKSLLRGPRRPDVPRRHRPPVARASARTDVRLPVTFLHSFRTSADSLAGARRATRTSPSDGVPLEILQNRVPKLRADDLTPVRWPADPSLEWCPPGHGDLYAVLHATGLIDTLLDGRVLPGVRLQLRQPRRRSRCPAWPAGSPRAARRSPSKPYGAPPATARAATSPCARRDGRIILRETAQTLPEDLASLADLDRHRFISTNNLWFDLAAHARRCSHARRGVLDLPLIRNVKTVDPADPDSPARRPAGDGDGCGHRAVRGRPARSRSAAIDSSPSRPPTTCSSCAATATDSTTSTGCTRRPRLPFVDLGPALQARRRLRARFVDGVPSLVDASSLVVRGDWTFGAGVRVVGAVELGPGGRRDPRGDGARAMTRPTVVARAPGRVNLIGDHTDYTGGLCLPMAIDRWVEVAGRPTRIIVS